MKIERFDKKSLAIYEENLRNIRVIDHWALYLFHRDQVENLKGGA
jgi:hypothetical protein